VMMFANVVSTADSHSPSSVIISRAFRDQTRLALSVIHPKVRKTFAMLGAANATHTLRSTAGIGSRAAWRCQMASIFYVLSATASESKTLCEQADE
jgi:hypothetical protein